MKTTLYIAIVILLAVPVAADESCEDCRGEAALNGTMSKEKLDALEYLQSERYLSDCFPPEHIWLYAPVKIPGYGWQLGWVEIPMCGLDPVFENVYNREEYEQFQDDVGKAKKKLEDMMKQYKDKNEDL